jgi:hypothetical protein
MAPEQSTSNQWTETVQALFATKFKSAPLPAVTVEEGKNGINISLRLRNGETRTLFLSKNDARHFDQNLTKVRIEAWVDQFRVVKGELADYNRKGIECPICGAVIRPNPENPVADTRALRWLSDPCSSCGTQISIRSSSHWMS